MLGLLVMLVTASADKAENFKKISCEGRKELLKRGNIMFYFGWSLVPRVLKER